VWRPRPQPCARHTPCAGGWSGSLRCVHRDRGGRRGDGRGHFRGHNPFPSKVCWCCVVGQWVCAGSPYAPCWGASRKMYWRVVAVTAGPRGVQGTTRPPGSMTHRRMTKRLHETASWCIRRPLPPTPHPPRPVAPTFPSPSTSSILDLLKSARDGERALAVRSAAMESGAEAARAAAVDTTEEMAAFFAALEKALAAQKAVMERVLAFEQKRVAKVPCAGGWGMGVCVLEWCGCRCPGLGFVCECVLQNRLLSGHVGPTCWRHTPWPLHVPHSRCQTPSPDSCGARPGCS
jgi:hypothetical protein